MDWTDLLSAIALVMVIEGLLPFANPRGSRRVMAELSRMPENKLRLVGLASIASGLLLLWLVRS
ncbi:DUF2065 domain-containing protein [Wenzhouxiangella sp. XN24]|uniref:DUF2065 domain-containing protein n=1 Tax=Wenzhouxiangella sp. XN24 TaxID=2713569 RepID=UPI0013EBDF0D|nr:DUF2065 domain-containing protein [Wenzhouxiangella sp. XN24]NGX15494.1 DUF2065 domain-containing protein [Wenzhouxiangella sp. XN24]